MQKLSIFDTYSESRKALIAKIEDLMKIGWYIDEDHGNYFTAPDNHVTVVNHYAAKYEPILYRLKSGDTIVILIPHWLENY